MKPILVTNRATRPVPRPLWARPPAARAAAVLIATVALVLLAAACSGSPSSTGAGGAANASGSPSASGATNSPSAVAYSHCMRSHGVPDFPDPGSGGQLSKPGAQRLGVSDSVLQAAQSACQHLLPSAASFQQQMQQCEMASDCPQNVVQHALNIMRRYAQCIRSHGVPNWPDPTIDSEGRPFFNVSGAGISHQFTHSSQFMAKDAECERQVGGSAGVPVPMG